MKIYIFLFLVSHNALHSGFLDPLNEKIGIKGLFWLLSSEEKL